MDEGLFDRINRQLASSPPPKEPDQTNVGDQPAPEPQPAPAGLNAPVVGGAPQPPGIPQASVPPPPGIIDTQGIKQNAAAAPTAPPPYQPKTLGMGAPVEPQLPPITPQMIPYYMRHTNPQLSYSRIPLPPGYKGFTGA